MQRNRKPQPPRAHSKLSLLSKPRKRDFKAVGHQPCLGHCARRCSDRLAPRARVSVPAANLSLPFLGAHSGSRNGSHGVHLETRFHQSASCLLTLGLSELGARDRGTALGFAHLGRLSVSPGVSGLLPDTRHICAASELPRHVSFFYFPC